jgi:hypothetical protein
MTEQNWENRKVSGRDEVLREIEKRANANAAAVAADVRAVMHDYEVDMYRLVLSIGRHYGMEKAYEIMSETVAEKRLKWFAQNVRLQDLKGSDVEKGFAMYVDYFHPKEEDFRVDAVQPNQIRFSRKDFIGAIACACQVLGLDVLEVNNKVYAQAMDKLLANINPRLRNRFAGFHDGWYDEVIELVP